MTSHFLSELISFLDGLPEPRIVMNADYRIVAGNGYEPLNALLDAAFATLVDAGDGVERRARRVGHPVEAPAEPDPRPRVEGLEVERRVVVVDLGIVGSMRTRVRTRAALRRRGGISSRS